MADSPSPELKISLPPSVESMIETICMEQLQPPPGSAAIRELESLGGEESLEILNIIRHSKIAKTFDGFVLYLARERKYRSSRRSSSGGFSIASQSQPQNTTDDRAGSKTPSPQFLALQGLEFRRLFLILSYIGRNNLEDVASVEEIQSLRSEGELLPMGAYEFMIWNKFGQRFCEKTDRLKYRNWDPKRKFYYYHCYVYSDGSYVFKGPYLNTTTTLLHRVLKDENVLIVKFAEEETKTLSAKGHINMLYSSFNKVAKKGISLGCKCYHFFGQFNLNNAF